MPIDSLSQQLTIAIFWQFDTYRHIQIELFEYNSKEKTELAFNSFLGLTKNNHDEIEGKK